MAFEDDKTALLDLVKVKTCAQADYINANSSDYDDLLDMLFEFASTFDCDQAYLTAILTIFDDAILTARGVYFNKIGGTIDNPKVIVSSTYTLVQMNVGGAVDELQIFNASVITNIVVTNNTQLRHLVISGGSTVTKLDSTEEGSCVEIVLIKACATFNSTLDKIVEGSCVRNLGKDADATFNGYTCEITTET